MAQLFDTTSRTGYERPRESVMKVFVRYLLPALLLLAMLWVACTGIRPLQKGEAVTCPSCGATFTIEEGLKNNQH